LQLFKHFQFTSPPPDVARSLQVPNFSLNASIALTCDSLTVAGSAGL